MPIIVSTGRPPRAVGQQGYIYGLQARSYGSGDGRLSPIPATGDPALSLLPMSEQLNGLAVERSGPRIAVRIVLYRHRPGFIHRRRRFAPIPPRRAPAIFLFHQ
jgi:hypothetical protein